MSLQHDDFYNDLISIVAHDLKTPISAVKGFIELVQQAGPLNDQQTYFSERALTTLQRMENLVSDLLEYTRLNAETQFDLVEFDLRQVIFDAVEMLEEVATRRQITFQTEVQEDAVLVTADARLIGQVVNNLISNAIKYNREGGLVAIRIYKSDENIRVDIQDTGFGIPQDDVHRVFDRFYRVKGNPGSAKVEGSGLGLAIVQTIIQKHNGRIWVESVEGEGSTFSFVLPLAGQVAEHDDPGDSYPTS